MAPEDRLHRVIKVRVERQFHQRDLLRRRPRELDGRFRIVGRGDPRVGAGRGAVPTPDDVAVLGGDDDPLLCSTAGPPLSRVLVASEHIGFQAAARLDRLMRGGRGGRGTKGIEPAAELIRPITVTTRGSTEALAIEDPELRSAMTFLRQNAYGPIGVDEIADAVAMARRSLERKFHELVKRTPLQEIRRLRLARVRELLAATDRSVADIAAAAGFGTPEYMTAIFRRFEGITPLRYRQRVRGL